MKKWLFILSTLVSAVCCLAIIIFGVQLSKLKKMIPVGYSGNIAVTYNVVTSTQQAGPATTTNFIGNVNPSITNQFTLGETSLVWADIKSTNGTFSSITTGSCTGCGGAGSFNGVLAIPYYTNQGSNSSKLSSTELLVATSTSEAKGTFYVDSNGSINASSSMRAQNYTAYNGSTNSYMSGSQLFIATSTTNIRGLFNVDSSGNTSVSGTLKTFGLATLSVGGQTGTDQNFLLGGSGMIQFRGSSTWIRENSGLQIVPASSDGAVYITQGYTTTNSTADVLRLDYNSSGTAAPGMVGRILWRGEDATGATNVNAGALGANLEWGANFGLKFYTSQNGTLVDNGGFTASGTLKLPISSSTVPSIWLSGVSSTLRNDGYLVSSSTLNGSTDEAANRINCTFNKMSGGNATCLSVDVTGQTSATGRYLEMSASGTPFFAVEQSGTVNNQILVPAGSILKPSIASIAAKTSGIYFNTTQINFVSNGSANQQFSIGTNAANLDPNGATNIDVGLTGTTTPAGQVAIDIDATGGTKPGFLVANYGSSTYAFAVGNLDQNGKVLINTSTPIGSNQLQGQLITDGRVYHGNLTTSITANGAGITTNGELVDCGAASCIPSALRYKTKVTPYTASVLDLYKELVDVGALANYQLKDSKGNPNGDPRKGLIADYVEKVDPDLVGYDSDGKVNTLHFEDLTGLSVKGINELNDKIKNQQIQINLLKNEKTVVSANSSVSDDRLVTWLGVIGILFVYWLINKLFIKK